MTHCKTCDDAGIVTRVDGTVIWCPTCEKDKWAADGTWIGDDPKAAAESRSTDRLYQYQNLFFALSNAGVDDNTRRILTELINEVFKDVKP